MVHAVIVPFRLNNTSNFREKHNNDDTSLFQSHLALNTIISLKVLNAMYKNKIRSDKSGKRRKICFFQQSKVICTREKCTDPIQV